MRRLHTQAMTFRQQRRILRRAQPCAADLREAACEIFEFRNTQAQVDCEQSQVLARRVSYNCLSPQREGSEDSGSNPTDVSVSIEIGGTERLP